MPQDEFSSFTGEMSLELKKYLELEAMETVNPFINDLINSNRKAFSGLTEVKKYVPQMSPFEQAKIKKEEEKEKIKEEKEKQESVGDEALIKAKEEIKNKSKETKKINKQKAEADKQKRIAKTTQNVGKENKKQPTYNPGGEQ